VQRGEKLGDTVVEVCAVIREDIIMRAKANKNLVFGLLEYKSNNSQFCARPSLDVQ